MSDIHRSKREIEDATIKHYIESCGTKVLSIDSLHIELELGNGARLMISSDDIHYPLEYKFKTAEEQQRN